MCRVAQSTGSKRELKTVGKALTTPRAAAIAGILFAVFLAASLYLVQLSISPQEWEDGSWLESDADRVKAGTTLIAFAGISFLWFIGVIRHQFGKLEDQFYSTVLLGSGLLFVAMLFVGMAAYGAILTAHEQDPGFANSSAYNVTAPLTVELLRTYALRMAGVFLFSLGTMWLRTGVMPRWAALSQFGVAVVLLFGAAAEQVIVLLFPLWILVISVYLLIGAYHRPADTPADLEDQEEHASRSAKQGATGEVR
jgi:hypothetical protein